MKTNKKLSDEEKKIIQKFIDQKSGSDLTETDKKNIEKFLEKKMRIHY